MRCYKILLLNWKIFNVSIFDKRLIKKTKSFGGAVHEVKKTKQTTTTKKTKNFKEKNRVKRAGKCDCFETDFRAHPSVVGIRQR